MAAPPKKRTSLGQFAREVRGEARKITWTTRRETRITSVMVAIMVVTAMVFFWLVDVGRGHITVYRDPATAGYGTVQISYRGDVISSLAFPDLHVAVTDILG